jgi:pimeloyl-ACP methyl ester carboxylesterase
LITSGTESPPFFKPIAQAVAEALPSSTMRTFEGAGHVPHLSTPSRKYRARYQAALATVTRCG